MTTRNSNNMTFTVAITDWRVLRIDGFDTLTDQAGMNNL